MKSLEELKNLRNEAYKKLKEREAEKKYRIVVGLATCGIAAGASPILQALEEEIAKGDYPAEVHQTGCIGMCTLEPIVEVYDINDNKTTYVHMTKEKALAVLQKHIKGDEIVEEYSIASMSELIDEKAEVSFDINKIGFYAKQKRIALRNCGVINPEDINEYIAKDGYLALAKVLEEMEPSEVIETLKASGLRGRGGAGFLTGLKWQFAADQPPGQKYIICNADEGDPGAFMDRSILEGDPHAVLEAMAIGGYTIGANRGYIYIRAEYPVAVERLNIAIAQAREIGLLGEDILGKGFDFDIEIRLGAGAFVCGEETALIQSIEGKRGMPVPKPPFPAVSGVWGKPTVINNVETYASVAQIILQGAEWFRSFGTEKSTGTKVFALGGNINNTGLVEIPMGVTLREVIYEIGGGCPNGKAFKAIQTGGPSGGCLTETELDIPIDFESLVAEGSMMGSGGMIVMDEDNCMVDIARYFMDFLVDESCGKCSACRIGTKRMLEMLNAICEGKGDLSTIDQLHDLAEVVKDASLCQLGQTAPNAILSTLKHFHKEYETHVVEKRCPARVCKKLLSYVVDPETCKKCGLCAKACPADCIAGELGKTVYEIDQKRCIKCGACESACPFGSISRS